MLDLRRPVALTALIAIAVLAVACGGAATAAPTGTQSGNEPTPATSEDAGAEPTEEPAPSDDGGGGIAGDACDLITADEAGGAIGESGVAVGMETPGDVSYCIYNDAVGNAVIATSLMKRGGSGAFGLWQSGAGVQAIDGLGDDAVFDPSSATLLVLNGDAIFSVTAGDGGDAEADRIEWSKALAEIALGRM